MPTCNTSTSDCCDELRACQSIIQENIDELFKRTDQLKDAIEGGAVSGNVGIISDYGQSADPDRDTAAALIDTWGVNYLITAGDNIYPDGEAADVSDRLLPFQAYIDAGIMFPAVGNHDMDNAGTPGQPLLNAFPYLPKNPNNHSRYYSKYFADLDAEFFFINSGYDSSEAIVEPDGNSIGSVQYTWFVEALQASVAKWKIVVFHHPYATSVNAGSAKGAMDWGFEALGVDLVINGHSHVAEHMLDVGLDMINVGSPTDPRIQTSTIHGLISVTRVWGSVINGATSQKTVVKLTIHPSFLMVTYYAITGEAIYAFVV